MLSAEELHSYWQYSLLLLRHLRWVSLRVTSTCAMRIVLVLTTTTMEIILLQWLLLLTPTTTHAGVVVVEKKTENGRGWLLKVIDFFGSHWTHATRPLQKSWSPQNGSLNCLEPFLSCSQTTTIPCRCCHHRLWRWWRSCLPIMHPLTFCPFRSPLSLGSVGYIF